MKTLNLYKSRSTPLETHRCNMLSESLNADFADSVRILYGGSAKPANADELFSQTDVDSGLIGGARLKVDDFYSVVLSAAKEWLRQRVEGLKREIANPI